MAYGDFKDLAKRTASDKVLRDKAFNIAKISKYDRYQRGLASMACKFFDKTLSISDVAVLQNQELAEERHKPITTKKITTKKLLTNYYKKKSLFFI